MTTAGPALECVLRPGRDDGRDHSPVHRDRPDRRLAGARDCGPRTSATSKGWLIFFGLAMFAFVGVIQLWGWRTLLRIQNIFFWMVTASLGSSRHRRRCSSRRATSRTSSTASRRTSPATPDAYQSTIATARKSRRRGRSELLVQGDDPDGRRLRDDGDLLLLVDVRRRRAASGQHDEDRAQHGARRHHSAHRRGDLARRSSSRRSAASSCAPRTAAACRPRSQVPGTTFFYLSGIRSAARSSRSSIFLLYIVFWPLITYISSLQQTRAIFAMSFDGVLPKGVTRVNRHGCPWLAC